MTIVEQEIAPEVLTERELRARVLEAAALEIEVRGWCRGQYCDESGGVCLLGGVRKALERDDDLWFWQVWNWSPLSDFSPSVWNDSIARDADDVTFVLRWRAAEIRDGR